MALFSRRPSEPSTAGISERCYLDPQLETAVDAVQAGQLDVGLRALAETRGTTDWRALRSYGLGAPAARHRLQLARLSEQHPDDADLTLLLGRATIDEAWGIRGGGWAETVGHNQFNDFWATLAEARGLLIRAAELAPDDATPWHELQWWGIGMQIDADEHAAISAEVFRRAPWLFSAHWARLDYLSEKWFGSHEQMFEYARTIAADAPAGNPVAVLVVIAHFEYLLRTKYQADKAGRGKAWDQMRATYFSGSVLAEITAAEAKWLSGRQPHPRDLEAHNAFGGAFFFTGDTQRAAWHLSQVGNRVHRIPWGYESPSMKVSFARARAALNLPAFG